jgi:hypothetical protein
MKLRRLDALNSTRNALPSPTYGKNAINGTVPDDKFGNKD